MTIEINRKEIASMAAGTELYTIEEIGMGKWRVTSPSGEEHEVTIFEIEDPEYMISCTCESFRYQKRICKHVAKVFKETFNPETNKFDVPKEDEWHAEEITFEKEGPPHMTEEEVEVLREEKKEEKKEEGKMKNGNDKIKRFANEIRGKLVVLYGEPFSGKTTLAHVLARCFDRTVYFKVDKNFSADDFGNIAKNVHYIDVDSPQQLLRELRSFTRSPPQGSLIVVDSVTSLDAFFISSDPTTPSPRMENARAKFADAVMQLLSFVKGQNTVIVIAHEKIRDFQTNEIVPRFNVVALRHSDMIFRVRIENGRRKVEKVKIRRPVEQPEFDFS